MAVRTSIPSAFAGWPETASREAIRSIGPHQMYAAAALGRERGVTQRHAPAVVTDDTQACELGRRVDRRSFSRISHRLLLLPSRYLRVSAFAGAPRTFHSANAMGCSPAIRQSLPHHQPISRSGDVLHISNTLSSSAAFAGFKTSEALNGRVPNFIGAFHKNEGELPNVCG